MVRRLSAFSPIHQASALLCYGITHAAPAEHCNTRSTRRPVVFVITESRSIYSQIREARGATSTGDGIGDRSGHSVPPAFLGRPNRLSTFWLFELVQYAISNADLRRSSTPERERAQGQARSEAKLDYWRYWRACEYGTVDLDGALMDGAVAFTSPRAPETTRQDHTQRRH